MLVGHSIGEFAAAVEAGVFTLDAAIAAVGERGRLMWSMQPGSMASILLSAERVADELPDDVVIAALNASSSTVVSGPTESIHALMEQLEKKQVRAKLLQTSHAFHSPMMAEAAQQFAAFLATLDLAAPQRPMVSNVTGTWLTDAEATNPEFWASQIEKPVRFDDCIRAVADEYDAVAFIELGPGRALTAFVQQNPLVDSDTTVLATSTPKQNSSVEERVVARSAVAHLWCAGVEPGWEALGQGGGQRVPLPTYPFERVEHWAPSRRHQLALPQFGELGEQSTARRNPDDEWLWAPTWSRVPYTEPRRTRSSGTSVLAFVPSSDLGDQLADDLRTNYASVITVRPAELYFAGETEILVRAGNDDDFAAIAAELADRSIQIDTILHAWTLGSQSDPSASDVDEALDSGLNALLSTARHLGTAGQDTRLIIGSTRSAQIFDDEPIVATHAALAGVARVIGLEFPSLSTALVDIENTEADARLALLNELEIDTDHTHIALRDRTRWTPDVVQLPRQNATPIRKTESTSAIRQGGHYLIVGGTGGVGLSLATHLATTYGAKLSLTSRSGYPQADASSSPETRRRVEVLDSLEQTSNGLAVFAADVSSTQSMETAVKQAEARFGKIHGVISAAGVADQGGMIQRRSDEDMRNSISSKVHGSLALAEVFDGYGLDFLMLSSSVAATLWHNRFAQVGYVTANAFVEALPFAKPDLPLRAVAWDDWTQIGMSVRAAEDFSKTYGDRVNLVDELNSFTPTEGVRVFEQALTTSAKVLVVSPTDLRERIRKDEHVESPFLTTALDDTDLDLSTHASDTVESVVRSAWCALLGYEEIADDDDFFDLGGDSLQAARLADRLSRMLDLEVELQILFQNPKLTEQIEALEELSAADEQIVEFETVLPLTPGQARFLRRQNPNPDHFNIATVLATEETIDMAALEAASVRLVETNPSLRTAIDVAADRQLVLDAESWTGFSRREIDDLDQLTEVCTERQRGLSLSGGNVFSVTLIDIASTNEQRVLIVMHHAISDRMSLLLLLDGLSDEYERALSGNEPPARPKAGSAAWLAALKDDAHGAEGQRVGDDLVALRWSSASGCLAPADRKPHQNSNGDGAAEKRHVDASFLDATNDVRPNELVLIALTNALAEHNGDDAAAVEVINNGRRLTESADVAREVGFFLTYVPVLLTPTKGLDTAALTELRRQMDDSWRLDSLSMYGTPDTIEAMASIPKIDVLYNFMGKRIATPAGQRFSPTNEDRGSDVASDGHRDHAIAVSAEQTEDGGIDLTVVYSRNLHDTSDIAALADGIVDHLTRLSRTPAPA